MKNKLLILVLIVASLLRLVSLNIHPHGLNADEAAIGYNAYSLIETGKDEHGATWPLVFRSFDDYKPPVYFYLVLPFVQAFGLNIWSVRLPSAFLGIASVYLLYLLIKKLFNKKEYRFLPELTAFILATSPWHLHFSRGGWEVNVATFFVLLSTLFFLDSFNNPKRLFLFGISTVISLYTYHSVRVIAPVLFAVLAIIYFNDVKRLFSKEKIKITLSALSLSVVLIVPLLGQMLSSAGQSRFSGVSIFADTGPVWEAENYRNEHQGSSSWTNIYHNKYFTYGMRFVKNYLVHYSPDFLFLTGDTIERSKVPESGQNLLCLYPFFLLGFFSVLKLNSKGKQIFLVWLLVAPLAAALTYQSPHALRDQNMSVPMAFFIATGIYDFLRFIKSQFGKLTLLISILLVAVFSYSFARYLNLYYVEYPKLLPYSWQFGFDQIASYTHANYNKYDQIIISDYYDQPYILIAFFSKYPPADFQHEIVYSTPDKWGFATGRKLGKYEFRAINFQIDSQLKNTLIISTNEEVDEKRVFKTIVSPTGKAIFKFISTN